MKLFFKTVSLSISKELEYRTSFIMRQLTLLIQILSIYAIWEAISSRNDLIFNFSRSEILTYVLASIIIRSLVFSTASEDIQSEISGGELNNYLQKPLNYLNYWFTRDVAQKLVQLPIALIEVVILWMLLKPPLSFPTSTFHIVITAVVVVLAMILYYAYSLCISFTTFWSPEASGWPQRFFSLVILEGLSGILFPLSIFPSPISQLLQVLPPAFLLYHPLQIFLGKTTPFQNIHILSLLVFWIAVFILLSKYIYKKGLKIYGAYGG